MTAPFLSQRFQTPKQMPDNYTNLQTIKRDKGLSEKDINIYEEPKPPNWKNASTKPPPVETWAAVDKVDPDSVPSPAMLQVNAFREVLKKIPNNHPDAINLRRALSDYDNATTSAAKYEALMRMEGDLDTEGLAYKAKRLIPIPKKKPTTRT